QNHGRRLLQHLVRRYLLRAVSKPKPTNGIVTTRPNRRQTIRATNTLLVPIRFIQGAPTDPVRNARGATKHMTAMPNTNPPAPYITGARMIPLTSRPDLTSLATTTEVISPSTTPTAAKQPPTNTICL